MRTVCGLFLILTLSPALRADTPLPAGQGQRWAEYDIRPYTTRIKDVEKPEQAIVDWILRETGTELWFGDTFGFMHATRDSIRVYHVPEVQARVKAIVERFTAEDADNYVVGARLVTVGSPNWRVKAIPMMRTVTVQSSGVDAWLISRENAALLLAQLRKRTDFSEQGSPNLIIHNGQSQSLSKRFTRTYVRSFHPHEGTSFRYDADPGNIEEGYSLLLSPLMSQDHKIADMVVKCQIDQVERFIPLAIDLPAEGGQTQRQQIEVPQLVSWRLHERFRWPVDQVLILSCGVVASPGSDKSLPLGLPNPLNAGPPRSDALLFLDCKGKVREALTPEPRTAKVGTEKNRGRY